MIWGEIVKALAGLMIALTAVFLLWYSSIVPLMEHDVTGFNMLQTRSGIYTRGFTLEEALGQRTGRAMFTPAHIMMLPAVDAQTSNLGAWVRPYPFYPFSQPVQQGTRAVFIYDELTFRPIGPNSGGLQIQTNVPIWERFHPQTLPTIHNRHLALRSWVSPSRQFVDYNNLGHRGRWWVRVALFFRGVGVFGWSILV